MEINKIKIKLNELKLRKNFLCYFDEIESIPKKGPI